MNITIKLRLLALPTAQVSTAIGPKDITMNVSDDKQARDVIFRLKRGLCGYVSYLASCEMNQAFSEYVLYEPILRIMTAQNYKVICEHICPGIKQPPRGDKKRLDFFASKEGSQFALEVKWITSNRLHITSDTEKLEAFAQATPNALPFLLLFGKKSLVSKVKVNKSIYKEWGTPVIADLRKTKYSCRVYRFKEAE